MVQQELTISYDPKADVLYCSFGLPQEAISEETDDGVIVRKHPDTGEIVGSTVVDFSRRFQERPGEAIKLISGAGELQRV